MIFFAFPARFGVCEWSADGQSSDLVTVVESPCGQAVFRCQAEGKPEQFEPPPPPPQPPPLPGAAVGPAGQAPARQPRPPEAGGGRRQQAAQVPLRQL
ncbi:small conductance calcium-activated potassium channel protein 3-like [Hypanus sabinus]|uniref:small conductance calcium-activated potassium channel protein 3-like n=1 Tax=Hypanus sabinus TaxID=79690 RepID=UPI0028C47A6F|nr:small conductance calcium-activated potassium channel protein 3-like [Hypanus sabinus]